MVASVTRNAFAGRIDSSYRWAMQLEPTDRTRHRRLPKRGSFDVALIHAVLDEALMCHVGFAVDGRPWVVPTIHARVDDRLYLHGAVANHMLGAIAGGVEACVTVTIVDGLVLARSAFHHSMDYRSVMVFGRASRVDDEDEKRRALHALVEHVVPGRDADVRAPSVSELRTTLVLRLPITEASAKVRTGGPIDDEDDLSLDVWAGVLPCMLGFGTPLAEPEVTAPVPDYLRGYAR
jgi:nitroimidazol reductase NimA-like FMN-containing flavoprotein (pyridoxamine 5'-phosphate oxidase superfamily)